MKKNMFIIIFSLLIIFSFFIGCKSNSANTVSETTLSETTLDQLSTTASTSSSTTKPTTTANTTISDSDFLKDEFVVINVYLNTKIDYYRAILINNTEIILLTSFGTIFQKYYNSDTGLFSIISFNLVDESINVSVDSKEYAWDTSLEQVYLTDDVTKVYMGRTGIYIRVVGDELKLSVDGLHEANFLSLNG